MATEDQHSGDEISFHLEAEFTGLSEETRRKYTEWIRNFYRDALQIYVPDYPASVPIKPFVEKLSTATVESWLHSYSNGEYSKGGLGQARSALAFVAKRLTETGRATPELVGYLKLVSLPDNALIGQRQDKHHWLSLDEMWALFDAANAQHNRTKAARDNAILWVMLTLGIRRQELVRLLWNNLTASRDGKDLTLLTKYSKWQTVSVPLETVAAINKWGRRLTNRSGLMFRHVHRSGLVSDDELTGNGVWKIVTDLWDRTGLSGGLRPHDLRRSAAQVAVDAGATVDTVRRGIGHVKPSSSVHTYIKQLPQPRDNKPMAFYIEEALLAHRGIARLDSPDDDEPPTQLSFWGGNSR